MRRSGEISDSNLAAGNWWSKTIPVIFILLWIFAGSPPCNSEAENEITAIRGLLSAFERGFAKRDIGIYMSVFDDEEYEYISDVTTPDDPSDDIHLLGAESEYRSALRIFNTYENIDLEMSEPEITVNGSSAEAENDFIVVFVTFEKPGIPSIYYAGGTNTFSLRKLRDEWKITRWQQHEMAETDLMVRMKEEQMDKGAEDLIRDLGSDRLKIWAVAVSDLRGMRGMAIVPLLQALRGNDETVRIRTASVLRGTRSEGVIRELIKVLEDEKDDVDVRVAVATALGECDSQIADNALSKTANGNNPRLRAAATLALARRLRKKMDDLYRIAVAGLQHEDEAVREAAAESVGIMMSMNGANLMEQRFKDRSESESVRLAAWGALKGLRSESVLSLFRDTLKDKNEATHIRIHAASALAEAKDHKALDLFMELAKDKKETFELRKEAIVALGMLSDSKATQTLIELLDFADTGLRREAIASLGRLGDWSALKPLVIALMNRDENIFVRRLAGRGIIKIDQDIAFGPLVQIMNDKVESAPARRMAAEELASFRDDRSIKQFIKVLKDEQQPWWLRQIAANHLGTGDLTSPCIEALEMAANDADKRIARVAQDALKK